MFDQLPRSPEIVIGRTAHGRREGAQMFARALAHCFPEDRSESLDRIVVSYREVLDTMCPNADSAAKDEAAGQFRGMVIEEFAALVLTHTPPAGRA
jgi:hypothetical protein